MNYIKRKSKKQEELTAKEFCGRTQPASGALSGSKGDVRTDIWLIEDKFTDSDKYKLELKTWKKIEKEALKDSIRLPMMQIDIQDLSLVLIDYEYLKELLGESIKDSIYLGFFNTPHKSITLKKKELKYLEGEPSVLVLSFGKKQLALLSKEQYFFLDFK